MATATQSAAPKTSKLRILGYVVLALILAVGVLLAIASTRPDDVHYERSAQIDAPPEVVFSIINDLHQWEKWSPYDERDPKMKKTFEGPSSGPGAIYTWNGNSQVGEGRLVIAESKPDELVAMKLEFVRPFAGNNTVDFKLEPTAGGTKVTWAMDGKANIMCKTMSLFIDMDKMCGNDFEAGLAKLNTAAKQQAAESKSEVQ